MGGYEIRGEAYDGSDQERIFDDSLFHRRVPAACMESGTTAEKRSSPYAPGSCQTSLKPIETNTFSRDFLILTEYATCSI